jgi:Tyrosine-protein kinase ephrin type A/B receptor-like
MQAVQILLSLSFVSTVSGNMCVICAAGKYRVGGSFLSPCLSCPANTFSARAASACEACPMHTFSAPGSASCEPDACVDDVAVAGCLCAAGSTGADGGPCTACGRDSFKNRTGSSNCTSCAVNETSAEGSAGCVCKKDYFGVSGDCAACPLELVSAQNSSECFCGDGALLRNGTCAAILPVRLHLTGVFGVAQPVMSPDEIKNATTALVLELSTRLNTSAAALDVTTWTDANDTRVRYSAGFSWTGVFPNNTHVMTDAETEGAKEALVFELAKVYNTSIDLADVKTWTDGNSTSVRYSVNISWTGVFPNNTQMMTDAEIEGAKEALVLELAKLYNTSADLLDVTTWTDGNETSVRYTVKLLVTGALDTPGPRPMSAEEVEAAKTALALEAAELYNTTTDSVHVTAWTSDDNSVHYRVNVSWTGAFEDPPDPPHVMSAAEIEAAKEALVLELAKLYDTSAHLVEVETWTDANGTRVHVSVYILLDGPESLNVTTGFPLLTQVKVDYEYGQMVYGKFRRCPTNKRVVNGSCACVAGYHERDGACESCSRGTYKDVTANTECLECAGNTYSGAAAGVCDECPPFSFEIEGHTRCVCRDGFILFRNECVEQQTFVTLEAELRHNDSSLLMLNVSTKLIASISSRFDVDPSLLFVTVEETSAGVYLAPAIEATTTPTPTSSTPAETETPETSTPAPNNESQAAGRRLLQLDNATRNDTTTPRPPDYFVRRIAITCVCPEGSAVCDQCLSLQDECYALEDTEVCGNKGSGVRRVGYVDYTGKLNVCAEGQVLQTDLFTRSKVCADKSTDAIALWMILLFVLLFVILISALGARFNLHHMIYVRWMPRGVSDGAIGWKGAPEYEKVPSGVRYPTPERPPAYAPPPDAHHPRGIIRWPVNPTAPPPTHAYALYELHFNK